MNRVLLRGAQVITMGCTMGEGAPNRPDAEGADILIEGGRPRCRRVQAKRRGSRGKFFA